MKLLILFFLSRLYDFLFGNFIETVVFKLKCAYMYFDSKTTRIVLSIMGAMVIVLYVHCLVFSRTILLPLFWKPFVLSFVDEMKNIFKN